MTPLKAARQSIRLQPPWLFGGGGASSRRIGSIRSRGGRKPPRWSPAARCHALSVLRPRLLRWSVHLKIRSPVTLGSSLASGRSKLTREPKQIDAQLGKQTGAELSALFVRRCLVPPSDLCRHVWISHMTKPAEDRVAGEFNPADRLTGPCDNFSIDVSH